MILTFRPIKVWPEGWPNNRGTYSRFDTSYARTLEDLDRELVHLGATDIALAVDASERDCRLDGQLRANAKVGYRGVILAFSTKKFGTLTYPCDTFEGNNYRGRPGWQDNLRAITLGLEALRKVERYGIAERGQQYAGYAELPSGIALGKAMTVEEAAAFIAQYSDDPDSRLADVLADPSFGTALFKEAAKRLHPDHGGDPDLFRKLVQAKELLEAQA